MTAPTPEQAAASAFVTGCVKRGLSAAQACVPPEGQPATVRGLWADVAQATMDAATEGSLRACGYTLADVGRFLEAEGAAQDAPPAFDPYGQQRYIDQLHDLIRDMCDAYPGLAAELPAFQDRAGQLYVHDHDGQPISGSWADSDGPRPAPAEPKPAPDLALLAAAGAHRDVLAAALARIEGCTDGYDPGTNENDVHEIAASALAFRADARPAPASASQVRRHEAQGAPVTEFLAPHAVEIQPEYENDEVHAKPAPEVAAEGTPPDVRPRSDGRRGLDITCGKCGEDYGTNVPDLDQIECPECGAHRCPQCRAWHGGDKW